MPVPADAVLPAPGMASQSGCTYRPLQVIGAGSYATVWHPSRALDVPCLARDLAVLPDFEPSRLLLQGPIQHMMPSGVRAALICACPTGCGPWKQLTCTG
jgi:hypothetical protein